MIDAIVTLADGQGAVTGMRIMSSNVATGCRSPDVVDMAVRQPGASTLKVHYADGNVATQKVDLTGAMRVSVTSERSRP